MVGIKTLADTLTSVRFLLALYLIWLGWKKGPEAIASAALTLLVAWITDVLDGPLARRDPRGIRTWIGDRDLEADMAVTLGVWIYLMLAGFLSPWLAGIYLVVAAVALWRFGSDQLAWGLQALPYGAMIWTSWRTAPLYGLLLVAWIGLVIVATWPRFPRQTVPEFLNGVRALWRQR
jgi:phosphatidylglycerophosphate synthase